MPKVFLTEEQRINARYVDMLRGISDNVAATKNREHLTQDQVAKRIGVSRGTIARLLSGEVVTMNTMEWLRILDFAGFSMTEHGRAL